MSAAARETAAGGTSTSAILMALAGSAAAPVRLTSVAPAVAVPATTSQRQVRSPEASKSES